MPITTISDFPHHGIRLLTPADPAIQALAMKHGARATNSPYTVAIVNDSDQAVLAFQYTWTVLYSESPRPHTYRRTAIFQSSGSGRIQPHTSCLTSASVWLEEGRAPIAAEEDVIDRALSEGMEFSSSLRSVPRCCASR